MTAFIDIRELDYNSVREIVEQSGCDWPTDNSLESRLFRFRVRRIATEAFRRGVESGQKINAAVATMFDDGAQEQGASDDNQG